MSLQRVVTAAHRDLLQIVRRQGAEVTRDVLQALVVRHVQAIYHCAEEVFLHNVDPFVFCSVKDIHRELDAALIKTDYISDWDPSTLALGSSAALLLYRLLEFSKHPKEKLPKVVPRLYRLRLPTVNLALQMSKRPTKRPRDKNAASLCPASPQSATKMRDTELLVMAFLPPRDLRAVQSCCRYWDRLLRSTPSTMAALERCSKVTFLVRRFYACEWGDVHLRLHSWS